MIQISYEFIPVDHKISFKFTDGSNHDFVDIMYSADVDLKELVTRLIQYIDKEQSVELSSKSIEANLTDKEKIINSTIKQIVENFNNIITQQPPSSDEAEPLNDDIPF